MTTPQTEADALCMQCGLCCDGTFFGSVVVAPEEQVRLRAAGLRVVDKDGALVMPQRCSALEGSLCSAYADRPKSCRDYQCTLRKSVLAGETPEAIANLNVLRMRTLLATIRASFDLSPDTSIWEAILAIADAETSHPAGPKLDAGVAAVSELLVLARDVFEPKFAGGGGR